MTVSDARRRSRPLRARIRCACRSRLSRRQPAVLHPGARRCSHPGSTAAFRITNGRPSLHEREEWRLSCGGPSRPSPHRPARRASRRIREAAPAHQRVRILERGNDAGDAGLDDPLDARTGSSRCGSTARACSTASRPARAPPRVSSARTSACASPSALVVALPHDHAVRRHHDGADHRIGARPPAPPRREARARGAM